jgi:L-methionine (R)-S-oxide reductase
VLKHDKIVGELEQQAIRAPTAEALMQGMANLLRATMVRCNWVAFYVVSRDKPRMLILGPYSGMDTPHEQIPFEKGICGAAASTGKTIVVPNVKHDPRYLEDSAYTKSEIVVPMFANQEVIGEIDASSFFEAAFDDDICEVLERCATLVSGYIEKHANHRS